MNSGCISPNILDKYIDGHLSGQQREQAEAHLAECDNCLEEFAIEKMLSSEDISTEYDQEAEDMVWGAYQKVKEKLEQDIVMNNVRSSDIQRSRQDSSLFAQGYRKVRKEIKKFRWLPDLQPPEWISGYGLSLARSPARSKVLASCGSVLIRKEMDDLLTEMYLEKSGDDNVCIWINVLKENKIAKRVFLTLERKGDHPFSRSRTLASGFQVFDKLSFGTYHLTLEQNDQEKGNYLFEIDDNGFYELETDGGAHERQNDLS